MISLKILAIPLLLVMLPTDLLSAERLRVAVSNYNLSSLSMGVAHFRGFFKEEGFDSEVIRMNPNVATTAAVTGDVDFSALIGSLIGATIKGAPLKLVACSQDRTPIVFVVRPTIKSVKELRGKTIGIPSYGSTPDVVGRMAPRPSRVYRPDERRRREYDVLYQQYKRLYDYFGRGENEVMALLRAQRRREN